MFATFLSYKEQERGGRVEFTPAPYTSLRCPAPGCGHTHANNRPTRDWFCCEVCGYEGHADVVGAINVSQGRILPVEPPNKTGRQEEAGGGAGQPWRLALLLTAVGIDLKAANLRVEAGAEAPPFSEGSRSQDGAPTFSFSTAQSGVKPPQAPGTVRRLGADNTVLTPEAVRVSGSYMRPGSYGPASQALLPCYVFTGSAS